MTYDEREQARYGGQPVECFQFVQGAHEWLYTSADREIVLSAGTFPPAVIKRKELDFSQEDTGETIEFSVPRTSPVAALFIGDIPSTPVWVTVYRAHRGDESLAVTVFTGRIIRARFEESEAILVGASLMALLARAVPVLSMQAPCNHALYSPGCGVDPLELRVQCTVESVEGRFVTSADFYDPHPWFEGGRLENADGETRFVTRQDGETLELISPMPGLHADDVVWAYPGCDHLESTCAEKFENLPNHLGWSSLPGRNPFKGRIL